MIDVVQDIHSMTAFKRNSTGLLKNMRKSGRPLVLTVNGKAEAVVLDAASYREVSSPRESHPEALSEPYVNLSAHTAPAMEPSRTPNCQCAHNFGSRLEIRATQ